MPKGVEHLDGTEKAVVDVAPDSRDAERR